MLLIQHLLGKIPWTEKFLQFCFNLADASTEAIQQTYTVHSDVSKQRTNIPTKFPYHNVLHLLCFVFL